MADGSLSIKRSITVRAVVTPRWKEDAERELSNAIAGSDGQLAQLEQEGQQLVEAIRSQSANPLDPRVQEQVGSVQEQVAAKRAELEEAFTALATRQWVAPVPRGLKDEIYHRLKPLRAEEAGDRYAELAAQIHDASALMDRDALERLDRAACWGRFDVQIDDPAAVLRWLPDNSK